MNNVKKTVVSTKNFVVRHKTAVAVATTVLVLQACNRKALNQHDEFLKEHGLFNEFYAPENSY
jgi:hypothetical protein